MPWEPPPKQRRNPNIVRPVPSATGSVNPNPRQAIKPAAHLSGSQTLTSALAVTTADVTHLSPGKSQTLAVCGICLRATPHA
jgi:hypothetical protein